MPGPTTRFSVSFLIVFLIIYVHALLITYVHIHICVCGCMCMRVCVRVSMRVCVRVSVRVFVDLRLTFSHSPLSILRQGLSFELRITELAHLAVHSSLGIHIAAP